MSDSCPLCSHICLVGRLVHPQHGVGAHPVSGDEAHQDPGTGCDAQFRVWDKEVDGLATGAEARLLWPTAGEGAAVVLVADQRDV